MNREERIQEARRLRGGGGTYQQIASALGVGNATVYRWLNPGYDEASRAASRAWKDRHREANRQRDRDRRFYSKAPYYRFLRESQEGER